MILPRLDNLPPWAAVFDVAAHFALGIVLGEVIFRSLWFSVRRFAADVRAARLLALMLGRLLLLGGVLLLVSLEGALPLLTTVLGLLLGRFLVMRRVREAAP